MTTNLKMIPRDVGGASQAYVHESAQIYGDIRLAEGASIWCNVVMRGEVDHIAIGAFTNIQDFVMIHIGFGVPTIVGAHCSITHHVTLHGCSIGDNCLIGIGATIMDGCVIGENSIVAGHAFLKEGTIVPPNSIVMGAPGKVVKTRNNYVANRLNAFMYHRNAEAFAAGNFRIWSDEAFLAESAVERERLSEQATRLFPGEMV